MEAFFFNCNVCRGKGDGVMPHHEEKGYGVMPNYEKMVWGNARGVNLYITLGEQLLGKFPILLW